ncbi:MAG TPA: tetratricopeptide repeat protein, partial [Candidatus Limnocylindrales bacterium]|nr:tetratricopeptide repeat protein [Candidatus Limnocylindrales bacterium]
MAEINLQEYVADIEAQLASGAADEASYHSRHILSQYPRYTPSFRLLGRALLLKGQQAEAEAAFRRVLSVEPADITAHLGLSEIYDQRHRGDEAIWHAERAMETEIANAVTTDLLRGLYRRYRGAEQPRMALTAVALTRQALQNQDYPQAIATLRDALERHPERVDLRLLLAEALWESGDHVTAGETALDVLEVLPDCFSANAIMTRLWLKEGRPSDARHYLNRLEALDPYTAVQLASGQPADPGAFTIDALDYQRSAQSEAARAAPAWLEGISGEVQVNTTETDWASGMLASAAAHESDEANAAPDDSPTQAVPAAVMGAAAAGLFVASPFGDDAEFTPALQAETPAFDFEEDPPTLQLPAAPSPASQPTAVIEPSLNFETLFAEELAESDAFVSPFDEPEVEQTPPPPSGATNPLPPLESVLPRPMPPAEDAMAWLRESGVELVDDEAPAYSTETGEEFPAAGPHDQADPMAWLNTYDSVLEENPAESELPPASTVMLEEGWEFDVQHAGSPELFAPETPAEDEQPETPATSGTLRGLTSRLGDPALTPAAPLAAAALPPLMHSEAAADDWTASFDDAPAAADTVTDSPDWLTDLGAVMTNEPDATPAAPDEHAEPLPTPEADESAAWLNEFSPEALAADLTALPETEDAEWPSDLSGSPAAAETEMPDWLMENVPEEPAAATEAGVKVPADDADVLPDWLVDNVPEAAAIGVTAAATMGGDSAPADEDLGWMNALNTPDSGTSGDLDEAVMAAQADVPDWLNALEAEALAQIDANQNPAAESAVVEDDEWLKIEPEQPAEPLPFDEPTALEVPPEEAEADGFPVEAAALAGGLGLAGAALAADAWSDEPAAEQPELSEEDWGEPEQADLSRIAPPTVSIEGGEPVSQPELAPDDWFADGQLVAEAPMPVDGSLAEMPTGDWFEDAALLAPAETEAAADEWASGPEFATSAVTQLGADTLPYVAPAAEIEAAQAEDDEDGLGFGAAALAGAGALGVLAIASDAGESETEAGEAAVLNVGDEDDEWLMAEWPEDAEGQQLAPDELDALPDADIAEETVIAPAANAPDWLNAMVPGLDMDYEVAGEDAGEFVSEAESVGALDET